MTKRSKKGVKPLQETSRISNVQQPTTSANIDVNEDPYIPAIRPLLGDENCYPSSSTIASTLSTNAAALYDELDSFRQRWKRELEETKQPETNKELDANKINPTELERLSTGHDEKNSTDNTEQCDSSKPNSSSHSSLDQLYNKAKKLFLIAVELEQDEMHHESIRYYKQAMHLCPDIERLIFREQCEASAKANASDKEKSQHSVNPNSEPENNEKEFCDIPLIDRILQSYSLAFKNDKFNLCNPAHKLKTGTLHISDLPHELILKIFHYIIGNDLDLASLESTGLVCRGLFLLSREPALWRSICYSTWGSETLSLVTDTLKSSSYGAEDEYVSRIDWRQMFLERPHINYDGVYISRTRYVRQGDVGFQDLTYRPFHVVRYYRYIRFFSDGRVLILTTNEEPDKIVPIFRHAVHSKQFSPDLSILDGTFEFVGPSQINIVAEKDCRKSIRILSQNQNQRRQAQINLTRQTPISQKFNLKFELKTVENKPYTNNVLKWLDYTIISRMETGQEVTTFDLAPDIFPSLIFARVKRMNLKLTNPLFNH